MIAPPTCTCQEANTGVTLTIMTSASTPLATSSAPFKYVGGDVALDFVNTVDWTDRGPERDRLTSYERLVEWETGADALSLEQGVALSAAARRHQKARDGALTSSLRLRAVLQRMFSAAAAGRMDDVVLSEFDTFLERALTQRTIQRVAATRRRTSRAGARFQWGWRDPESFDSISHIVVWQAAALLVADDASLLRVCEGDDCGWMFVDRSRNGLRRWCEMDVCGMKEKNRRRGAQPTR